MLRDKPITKTLFILSVVMLVLGRIREDKSAEEASNLLSLCSNAAWIFLEDD